MSQIKQRIECRTKAEFDACIAAGNIAVCFDLQVVLKGSSSAVLRGSSSAVLWESSRAELRESSSAEAYGNVFLRVFSARKIKASASAVIMMHGKAKSIIGGKRIKAVKPTTAAEWCKFHGVEVKKGIATLYKGLDENFMSDHGGNYEPGEMPKSETWNATEECGSGLHFSPTPAHTLQFKSNAKKFIACGVRVSEIAIHPDGDYPNKCKAPRVVTPCYEVDRKGKRV